MMKVVQVCSAVTIGGGETLLLNLIAGLRRLGVEVSVAARPQAHWLPRLPRDVPVRMLPLRGAIDLWSAWRLGSWCEKHNIDIVHAHPARDYILAAFAAKKFASARFVLTRHVHYPITRLALYRRWLRLADAAVVHSARVASSLGGVFDRERVRFIPAGIDIAPFSSATRIAKGNVLRVGVLGQVAPHKGQEDFVRAVEHVALQHMGVEYYVIGDARPRDAAYLENLHALAERNRMPIQFLPFQSDTPALLANLDVVVVPSWDEPFGMVVIEAMAAGRPVVAARAGGPMEILEEDRTGLFFTARNVEDLARVLTRLLADPDLRTRLGRAAAQVAQECNSYERMAALTLALYQEVLLNSASFSAR